MLRKKFFASPFEGEDGAKHQERGDMNTPHPPFGHLLPQGEKGTGSQFPVTRPAERAEELGRVYQLGK
jgi:hypothetical protein